MYSAIVVRGEADCVNVSLGYTGRLRGSWTIFGREKGDALRPGPMESENRKGEKSRRRSNKVIHVLGMLTSALKKRHRVSSKRW